MNLGADGAQNTIVFNKIESFKGSSFRFKIIALSRSQVPLIGDHNKTTSFDLYFSAITGFWKFTQFFVGALPASFLMQTHI